MESRIMVRNTQTREWWAGLVGLLLLVQAGCLLIPDDREKGQQVSNQRPTVRITGGAASPDPAGIDYKVQFFWSGSDVDGRVLQYEWAVDDTVTERAWKDTTGFTARINFPAGLMTPTDSTTFTGWHTFYIRAVDNENALSVPDERYFNARTVAPVTRITFPRIENNSFVQLQPTHRVRWEGEDLDCSRPDRKPLYYEYKLVRLTDGSYPSSNEETYRFQLRDNDNELSNLTGTARKRWIRVPNTVEELTLRDLPTGKTFAFAVRGVDEAGAIEPKLNLGRNYLAYIVSSSQSKPEVIVTETRLGSHSFPSQEDPWDVEVPSGVPLKFEWVGDASSYGSEAGNSNYAIDVLDPEDEGVRDDQGIGGWIGWGTWPGLQVPITFTDDQAGSIHYLYVKMRDISDSRQSETVCRIRMKVVGFTFSKFALVVDDARFQDLTDQAHDRFVLSFLRRLDELKSRYGLLEYTSIFQDFNEGGTQPAVIPLSVLADYRHIVWSLQPNQSQMGFSWGLNGGQDNNDGHLGSYVAAGGHFFAFGGRITGTNRGDFGYPVGPPANPTDVNARMFYWKFFYMPKLIVSAGCADNPICDGCYSKVSGLYAVRSLDPAFPDITLDVSKWNPWQVSENGDYRGGIPAWEGSITPTGEAPVTFAGLDSLYAANTWDRSREADCNHSSRVSGAICGQRYESTAIDTLLNRQHGRIIVLNFQPYYFVQEQATSAGTAAINWLVTGRDQ